jgi:hypothetical protein
MRRWTLKFRLLKNTGGGHSQHMGVVAGPVLKEDEEEVEVVPLSEVRDALLGEEAVEALARQMIEREPGGEQ